MADTPQTLAANLAAAADTIPDDSYSLQAIRNILLSYPPYDAISGLATPNLIRGTYDGAAEFIRNGGAVGDMSGTPSQRATNGTVLNAVFAAAVSNGKMLDLPPNSYEINNAAGVAPPPGAGFVLRGSRAGTIIAQFYNGGTGGPICSFGDQSNSNILSTLYNVSGLSLKYGASQSGLTTANALQINNMAWSKFDQINIGGGSVAYNNIFLGNAAHSSSPVFSCSFSDFNTSQAQQNQLLANSNGTGNVFENTYLNNGGSGTFNALGGSYINFQGGVTNEMTFIQLNCEWGACNQLMNIQNMVGLRFIDLHIEGIKMTGFNPAFFFTAGSAVTVDTCDLIDVVALSANLTGTPAIIADYNGGSSTVQINTFTWINNNSGQINTPVLMNLPAGGTLGDDVSVITVNKGQFSDPAGTNIFKSNFQFDAHMPVTSSQFRGPRRFGSYEWGSGGSIVTKAVLAISATYTHYSQYQDASIVVPSIITSFTITLAHTMGATGTQATPTGSLVHIRRASGSGSGTLTVADASSGTIGSPGTTGPADFFYQFNGTNWVAYTQVT